MKSWIVNAYEKIFSALSWVSPYKLLKYLIKPLSTPGGVELWVVGNLILALSFAIYSSISPYTVMTKIFMWYGIIRIFEITIYQINVLFFDKLRCSKRNTDYKIEGYIRIVLLILQNCIEIILWFCVIISYNIPEIGDINRNFPELLINSFSNFTGFGLCELAPTTIETMSWMWAESVIGLFMLILVLARFIGILPIPRSKTPNE
jgi:hypothetical protein